MPSSVRNLMGAAGLEYGGTTGWNKPIPSAAPGVYLVALTADPDAVAGVVPAAPISHAAISELLSARPELTVDGARPNGEVLTQRVSEFWLADESVLYVGLAGSSLHGRIQAYYTTKLGRRSPHAGGWFVKLLKNLNQLHVHYTASHDPTQSEYLMLEAFVAGVSSETRNGLRDLRHPFPFANLEWPRGVRKDHGIRGATGTAGLPGPAAASPEERVSISTRPIRSGTDVEAINQFLQSELRRRARNEATAVEAARWLDRTGLLRDSQYRPGLPLRNLLRAGRIRGQRQELNSHWFIDRLGS